MALSLTPPPQIDPITEGSHQAIITQMIDKGHQETEDYNTGDPTIQHEVHICFELPHELDAKDRRRQISRSYKLSLHKKAGFRKVLNAAFGKALEDNALALINPRDILGKNVTIQVERYQKRDGTKGAKVTGVSPLPKGMPEIAPVGKLLFYEIESGDPPKDLPDWLIKTINESFERRGLPVPGAGSATAEETPDIPPPPSRADIDQFDEFDGEPVVQPPPAPAKGRPKGKAKKSA